MRGLLGVFRALAPSLFPTRRGTQLFLALPTRIVSVLAAPDLSPPRSPLPPSPLGYARRLNRTSPNSTLRTARQTIQTPANMARGLFAVYRDDTAGPSAAAASGAATCAAGSTNRGSLPPSRRHDGSTARLAGSRGLGLREKENLDPFAVRPVRMGKGELGKGKLAAGAGKGGKVEGGVARPAPSRRGLGASAQVLNRGEASVSRPSENGICTGSLRTRVLPDLPPLPAPTPEPTSSSSRPTTVRLGCPDGAGSAESSPRTSCDTSFGSATDSGYAQSPRRRLRPGASPAEEEHGSEVPEAGNAFEDETDSDMSMVDSEVSGGVKSADRRARALTESPLAEVSSVPVTLSLRRRCSYLPTTDRVRCLDRSRKPSPASAGSRSQTCPPPPPRRPRSVPPTTTRSTDHSHCDTSRPRRAASLFRTVGRLRVPPLLAGWAGCRP